MLVDPIVHMWYACLRMSSSRWSRCSYPPLDKSKHVAICIRPWVSVKSLCSSWRLTRLLKPIGECKETTCRRRRRAIAWGGGRYEWPEWMLPSKKLESITPYSMMYEISFILANLSHARSTWKGDRLIPTSPSLTALPNPSTPAPVQCDDIRIG